MKREYFSKTFLILVYSLFLLFLNLSCQENNNQINHSEHDYKHENDSYELQDNSNEHRHSDEEHLHEHHHSEEDEARYNEYINMLKEKHPELLEDKKKAAVLRLYVMHGGAAPHFVNPKNIERIKYDVFGQIIVVFILNLFYFAFLKNR